MCTATACGKAGRDQHFASRACENDLFRFGMSAARVFSGAEAKWMNDAAEALILRRREAPSRRMRLDRGLVVRDGARAPPHHEGLISQLTPRKSRLPTSTPLCRRMPWAVVAWK